MNDQWPDISDVVQWFQYFRDICYWKLLDVQMRLGGLAQVVQID